jgi:peptide/nickel transport system substrate-binding protein
VFGTDFEGAEMLNPWLNPPLPANGDKAWFGWPTDDQIEALRKEWLQASDSETRQEIAAKIHERAFESVPYIPTGQYLPENRLPQEREWHHRCPGLVHVEHQEELTAARLC